jgi:hypothetical protein
MSASNQSHGPWITEGDRRYEDGRAKKINEKDEVRSQLEVRQWKLEISERDVGG